MLPVRLLSLAMRLRSRLADRMEVRARSGHAPLQALQQGIADSHPACAALSPSGDVVAVFGVVPHPQFDQAGIVWLLGADELVAEPRAFLRSAEYWIARLHRQYLVLGNFIDAGNTVHQRWLQWLGFRTTRRIDQMGVERRAFIEFQRRRASAIEAQWSRVALSDPGHFDRIARPAATTNIREEQVHV